MAEQHERYLGGVTFNTTTQQYYAGDHTATGIPQKQGSFLGTQTKVDEKLKLDYTLNASLSSQYASLLERPAFTPLQAAPAGQGNSQNLTHLQLIRLFPQMQGKPTKYWMLERAFVKRNIEKLEFRESFQSVDSLVMTEQERLAEAYKISNYYSELKYNLKKLLGKVVTPREDLYRTIINPMTIDFENLQWAFEYRRNRLALEAIKKITWGVNGRVEDQGGNTQTNGLYTGQSAPVDLGQLGAISTGFHSTEHVATKLNDAMIDFMLKNDVSIDTIVMSNKAYSRWNENTWTRMGGPTGLQPMRFAKGAVTTLPGFEGITCIIDPMLDIGASVTDTDGAGDNTGSGRMYCLDSRNALRLGEGPKLTRKYRDEERDADIIRMTDFFQHMCVDYELSTYASEGEVEDPYHDRIGNRWFSFMCTFGYGYS